MAVAPKQKAHKRLLVVSCLAVYYLAGAQPLMAIHFVLTGHRNAPHQA